MDVGACPRLSYDEIVRKMVCLPDEPKEFHHFLSKFKFLDKIKWTEELVAEKMKYVCDGINNEPITGAFLDFSVSKYRHIGWSLEEGIEFILDRLHEYSNIPIVPIISIKYESPDDIQVRLARVIEDDNMNSRIGGIDFVGNTSKFNVKLQQRICDMWRGKLVRMHVGESEDYRQVRQAIQECHVTNIAHGIKIIDCKDTMYMANDRGIVFDIAPRGNYITGVIPESMVHPAKTMFDHDLIMTVGSDDPVTFNTTLLEEYELLARGGFRQKDLQILADESLAQLHTWIDYSVGKR